MSFKPPEKIVSKQLERQKSSPQIGLTRSLKTPPLRSRTPPPIFRPTPASAGTSLVPKKLVNELQCPSTNYAPRNRLPAKAAKSAESVAHRKPVKCTKETLNKSDNLDLAYNAYLQTCLMVAYAKNIRQQNEQEILNDLEDLHMKLITVDRKINTVIMNLEKMNFLKETKEVIIKKIGYYQNFIDSVDEHKLDEQIRVLEEYLNVIQMENFKLPDTETDAQLALKYLQDIAKELNAIPMVEAKIQPLNQLHSSLSKTKEHIQKEEELRNECEKKLKIAESLLYHELYLRTVAQVDPPLK